MSSHLVTIVLTNSSDFRIHRHGGICVDVRAGNRNGRQMTARNPGTHAEALAFVEQLRDAAFQSDREIEFDVIDTVV